jgi:hypothetical protein
MTLYKNIGSIVLLCGKFNTVPASEVQYWAAAKGAGGTEQANTGELLVSARYVAPPTGGKGA